jgi:hypothetical protein
VEAADSGSGGLGPLKAFYNMLFFAVALQSACFLMSAFKVFGPVLNYPMGDSSSLLSLKSMFQLTPFTAIMGVSGAAAVTIVGILTRSGTYALYAVLIFAIGAFFPIAQYFFLAIPNTIGAIVAATGAGSDIVNPLGVTLGLWVAVWIVLYVFGLFFQREMQT